MLNDRSEAALPTEDGGQLLPLPHDTKGASVPTDTIPTDLEDAELTLASYVRAAATKRRLLIEQVQLTRKVYGFRPCWPANSEMATRAQEQDLKDTLAKAVDMVSYLAELDPSYTDDHG